MPHKVHSFIASVIQTLTIFDSCGISSRPPIRPLGLYPLLLLGLSALLVRTVRELREPKPFTPTLFGWWRVRTVFYHALGLNDTGRQQLGTVASINT